MKNNNQPLKRIYHQDIYSVQNSLEQLCSWNEPLKLVENFFSDTKQLLNKQRIAKEYYAQAKIFTAFISDYQLLMEKMNKQISVLKNREKI